MANGVLRIDAGRRCSTGDGRFFFRCSPPNGQPVSALVTQIRQLALEAKQRVKQRQMSSSVTELPSSSLLASNGSVDKLLALRTSTDAEQPAQQQVGTLPRARSRKSKNDREGAAGDSAAGAKTNGINKAPTAMVESLDESCFPHTDSHLPSAPTIETVRAMHVRAVSL